MATVNLVQFRKQVKATKRGIRNFLTRLEKNIPKGMDKIALEANNQAWKETECLDCANCCKTMSPTYTKKDIARISRHLGMKPSAFREKWLYKDRVGDWMNKKQPCQFLDLTTNMCNIYAVRPADCAGFPHHAKKMKDYMDMFKQNIEFCPATYRMVEKIMKEVKSPE